MFHTKNKSGMTLVEVLVAMTVFSLAMLGVSIFTTDTGQMIFASSEKLKINRDVREFTAEITHNARTSNHFFIYPSIAKNDRNETTDRLRDGRSGDFLLLIYQEPYPGVSDPVHITDLIGYFRYTSDANEEGPVYRFEIHYDEDDYKNTETYTPEALIDSFTVDTGTYEEIIELSRGLADGQLFYNLYDKSIMVKAEILHGNDYKRITDTYNFTVSPRG